VFANRGVSGIDGTLSCAAGVASGLHVPVGILIGDLAFHHDQTGLLALQKYGQGSEVVLINNHGGGIFHQLPIAEIEPPFTELFRTPVEVDIESLVDSYGGDHQVVNNRERFLAAFGSRIRQGGFGVIEYESDIEDFERIQIEIHIRIEQEVRNG
jgi:2-succinyl-5-enolpyruvyl-6-hydroxy-3-cyclohexene-1-carboxylate synthase